MKIPTKAAQQRMKPENFDFPTKEMTLIILAHRASTLQTFANQLSNFYWTEWLK